MNQMSSGRLAFALTIVFLSQSELTLAQVPLKSSGVSVETQVISHRNKALVESYHTRNPAIRVDDLVSFMGPTDYYTRHRGQVRRAMAGFTQDGYWASLSGRREVRGRGEESRRRILPFGVIPKYGMADRDRLLRPDLGLSIVDLETALEHTLMDEFQLETSGQIAGLNIGGLRDGGYLASEAWLLGPMDLYGSRYSDSELWTIYQNAMFFLRSHIQVSAAELEIMTASIESSTQVLQSQAKDRGESRLSGLVLIRVHQLERFLDSVRTLQMIEPLSQTEFAAKSRKIKDSLIRSVLAVIAREYDSQLLTQIPFISTEVHPKLHRAYRLIDAAFLADVQPESVSLDYRGLTDRLVPLEIEKILTADPQSFSNCGSLGFK